MDRIRRIEGEILFPPDAVDGVAARILVELRDVSLQDAASTLLAATSLEDILIGPHARVPFVLDAPAAKPEQSLGLRVQVDLLPDQPRAGGDYLSTFSEPVPSADAASGMVVALTRAVPLHHIKGEE